MAIDIRDKTTRDWLIASGQLTPARMVLTVIPTDYKKCLKMDELGHHVAAIRIENNKQRELSGGEPEVFFPTLPPDDWAWSMKDEDVHY